MNIDDYPGLKAPKDSQEFADALRDAYRGFYPNTPAGEEKFLEFVADARRPSMDGLELVKMVVGFVGGNKEAFNERTDFREAYEHIEEAMSKIPELHPRWAKEFPFGNYRGIPDEFEYGKQSRMLAAAMMVQVFIDTIITTATDFGGRLVTENRD